MSCGDRDACEAIAVAADRARPAPPRVGLLIGQSEPVCGDDEREP